MFSAVNDNEAQRFESNTGRLPARRLDFHYVKQFFSIRRTILFDLHIVFFNVESRVDHETGGTGPVPIIITNEESVLVR
jgi:hypothetical protein